MGVALWKSDVKIEPEEVTRRRSSAACPSRSTASASARSFELVPRGEPRRRPPRPRHERPDREPRHRREEPRHLRGAGHGAPAPRYERLLSAIHNENTIDLYFTLGRRLGRLLYEGKWFDPEAMLLKEALMRWIAPSVTGAVTLELRRGDDYTILDTQAEYMAYAPEKLSMERVEDARLHARGPHRRARDAEPLRHRQPRAAAAPPRQRAPARRRRGGPTLRELLGTSEELREAAVSARPPACALGCAPPPGASPARSGRSGRGCW